MKILQLFHGENEILATDGIMYVDGRLTLANIKHEVRKRNEHYKKNFPHKLADSFAIYHDKIGGSLSAKIWI